MRNDDEGELNLLFFEGPSEIRKTRESYNVEVSSSFRQQMALVLRMFQFSTKNTVG